MYRIKRNLHKQPYHARQNQRIKTDLNAVIRTHLKNVKQKKNSCTKYKRKSNWRSYTTKTKLSLVILVQELKATTKHGNI